MKYTLFLLLIISYSSCSKQEYIDVFFSDEGRFDFIVDENCRSIGDMAKDTKYTDTIFISQKNFDEVSQTLGSKDCLCKSNSPTMMIRHKNGDICIHADYTNCMSSVPDYLLAYKIRQIVKFYGCFTYEEISLMPEIQKYGMPKRLQRLKSIDIDCENAKTMKHPPREFRRVIVIPMR